MISANVTLSPTRNVLVDKTLFKTSSDLLMSSCACLTTCNGSHDVDHMMSHHMHNIQVTCPRIDKICEKYSQSNISNGTQPI